MTTFFSPPSCNVPDDYPAALRNQGYAVLDAQGVAQLSACSLAELQALGTYWEDLPPDLFLKDGGHYRRRRHSSFVVDGDSLTQVPHRAHWQPLVYNALHGGMQRMFEPIAPTLVAQPVWTKILLWLGRVCSDHKGARPWFVEAHQFRIDTTDGIGRPTPEGAHRDGVDMVAVFLLGRRGIKGGETRVFEANGPHGQRFTLTEPWSVLLLDDARVIHESTPIQPLDTLTDGAHCWRDTLVVTLRAGAFQDEGTEI
jgi:hypothetical protein